MGLAVQSATQCSVNSSAISSEALKVCTRCVMDTTDPNITFEDGVCHHCRDFERNKNSRIVLGAEGEARLQSIVQKIKEDGKGSEYDCILGISGGVDSAYVAYKAKQLGLRPLAVHFDNGWNSELAVSNIEATLNKLGIDLFTYVVDWNEFKNLQLSILKASTPDAEIPTDHAIYALLIQTAIKHGVKYILNGMNYSSEGIVIPAWAYGHSDWRYIKDVQKKFGSVKLKTYPHYSLLYLFYAMIVRRVKFVSILNYIEYDKEKAIEELKSELNWRPYGGKHHESVYTRFFQSYILPRKFNIDKRKAHLSNLIHSQSGDMTRERALQELKKDPCDAGLLSQDLSFVVKKMDLTEVQFEEMMQAPLKCFRDYKTNYNLVRKLKKLQHFMRKVGIFYK
ncbi:MAG: N-acetyl sugar amidotransferase [bacterium]|nr:N-acetyl sugar amidotransferase [bacterium]